MIYIYKERIINIQWTVMKGTSQVKENFDRALLKLFLIGANEKYLLDATASDGVVYAEVPQGLPEGTYSVELIYVKNWQSLDRPPEHHKHHPVDCRFNSRCIMRSRKDELFAITNYETESENIGHGEVIVRLKTSVASYGYDGLSAYEIAVMRGDFTGTEGEWLDTVGRSINMYFYSYLGNAEDTRLQVPSYLRRTGLWISYVKDDKTVFSEWYAGDDMSDDAWKLDSNWRTGSNMLVGELSISSSGNWIVNGKDTGIKAIGEQGITPVLRIQDNKLQVSYSNGSSFINVADNPVYTQFRESGNKIQQSTDLGKTWNDISDNIAAWFRWNSERHDTAGNELGKIQISRDNGNTWSDFSGSFTNNLHIKGYVDAVSALPSSAALGDIYGVGPTYASDDTEHTNPIYRIYVKSDSGWVDNGQFTSISAGVTQEITNSETTVPSNKAVTDSILKSESKIDIYECESYVMVAEKVVNVNNFVLIPGKVFKLKFARSNGVDGVTLKVGETEQKPLYYNGSQASSTNYWDGGEIVDVYYDGEVYQAWSIFRETSVTAGGNKALAAEAAKILNNKFILIEKDYGKLNLKEIPFIVGGYIETAGENINIVDGTPVVVPHILYKYAIVNCTAGESFMLDGRGGWDGRLWAFADSNYNILSNSVAANNVSNLNLIAPSGSAFLFVNIYTDLEDGRLYKGTPNYMKYPYKRDFKYNLSANNFDYAIRCIHHDNFFRESQTKPWEISHNTRYDIMHYYSLRNDYATTDDGFRIEATYDDNIPNKLISGYLTNNQSITTGISKAFRFFGCTNELKEAFYIELSCPSKGCYSEIVLNFYNEDNYDAFEFVNTIEDHLIIKFKTYKQGFITETNIVELACKSASLKLAYSERQLRIYVDDSNTYYQLDDSIQSFLNNYTIDTKQPLGISIDVLHKYEYRSIAIYNIVEKQHSEANRSFINNFIPYNMLLIKTHDYQYETGDTLRICGVGEELPDDASKFMYDARFINLNDKKIYQATFTGWEDTKKIISDYIMYFDTYNNKVYGYNQNSLKLLSDKAQDYLPKFVQRFEVRAEDVVDSASARVEVIENQKNNLNYSNLRKRHIKFKSFLPISYISDDNTIGGESIIQFQASTEGGQTRGPLFVIAADTEGKDNKMVRYHTHRRCIPTRPVPNDIGFSEDVLGEDNIDLGEAKLGVWESWDIYFKEGYMQEHCPLVIILRNDKEVYRSILPNCQNITFGSYIRYGIYKSIYKDTVDKTRKRIIYVADFEYTT